MEFKKQSAIIITDDDHSFSIIEDEFIEQKYRVIRAKRSDEARLKFSNEKFDLIVVDIDTLSTKSIDLVEFIRRKDGYKNIKEIKPILIIGTAPEIFTKDYSTMDHTRYLEKPFDKRSLKKKSLEFTGKNSAEVINNNTKVIKTDEYLITEGSNSHEMYWVLSGTFLVTKMNNDNKNIVIGEVYSGELVGEMSFLDNQSRSASVKAIEDSEVLVIPHKKFIDVIEGQPRWFRSLMQTLSQRLRNSNKMIARKFAVVDQAHERSDQPSKIDI